MTRCEMCGGAPVMGRRYGYAVCDDERCHEQAHAEREYAEGSQGPWYVRQGEGLL